MKRSQSTLTKRMFIITITLVAILIPVKLFAIEDTSPWFKNSELEFSTRDALLSDVEYPRTYGMRGNTDCDTLTFTKRDGDPLPFLPLHKESQVSGCYISTANGFIDTNGFANISGSNYVGEVVKANNTPTSFFSFPNSDVFISSASGTPAVGVYVWFDHLATSLTYDKDNFGRIRAVITPI